MPTLSGNTVWTGTARDVMRIQLVTVVPEMTVRELAETLVDAGVPCAPVLDTRGGIMGVASLADAARLAMGQCPRSFAERSARRWPRREPFPGAADGARPAPAREEYDIDRVLVREIMGPVGPAVSPGEPVQELVRRFARDQVPRALVVENGMLLGMVTAADVLDAIDEFCC